MHIKMHMAGMYVALSKSNLSNYKLANCIHNAGRFLLQWNVYFTTYLKYVKKRYIMKQRITVTVDSDSYQLLKAYDVNISGLVSTTMQNEARRLRAERWQEENREGMAEVASFLESNGSFADENRDW